MLPTAKIAQERILYRVFHHPCDRNWRRSAGRQKRGVWSVLYGTCTCSYEALYVPCHHHARHTHVLYGTGIGMFKYKYSTSFSVCARLWLLEVEKVFQVERPRQKTMTTTKLKLFPRCVPIIFFRERPCGFLIQKLAPDSGTSLLLTKYHNTIAVWNKQ